MTRDIVPEPEGVAFGVFQRVNANRTPEIQQVADQVDHAAQVYDDVIVRMAGAERQAAVAFGRPYDETRGLLPMFEEARAELERVRAHLRR